MIWRRKGVEEGEGDVMGSIQETNRILWFAERAAVVKEKQVCLHSVKQVCLHSVKQVCLHSVKQVCLHSVK